MGLAAADVSPVYIILNSYEIQNSKNGYCNTTKLSFLYLN